MTQCEKEKLYRIRTYCEQHGFTGMILGRQDNFRWITTGGHNTVIIPQNPGVGIIVVTKDRVWIIAQVMDGQRIVDEETRFLEAEYIPLHWYEESPLQKALEFAGNSPVSDLPIAGVPCRLEEIYDLHFPLLEIEIERLKTAGALSDQAMTRASEQIEPGMTEQQAAAILQYEYAKRGMVCDVLLVGSDQRIFGYRHPSPSEKKIEHYLLLHAAAQFQGLHANVTRCVYFGNQIPEEIDHAYQSCCEIEALCLSKSRPGIRWSDILEDQKRLGAKLGYPESWRGHYPGGRTGYFVCQPDLSQQSQRTLVFNEAYDWFITVPGAKVEELAVCRNDQIQILSNTGEWPCKTFRQNGISFDLPQIWIK